LMKHANRRFASNYTRAAALRCLSAADFSE